MCLLLGVESWKSSKWQCCSGSQFNGFQSSNHVRFWGWLNWSCLCGPKIKSELIITFHQLFTCQGECTPRTFMSHGLLIEWLTHWNSYNLNAWELGPFCSVSIAFVLVGTATTVIVLKILWLELISIACIFILVEFRHV